MLLGLNKGMIMRELTLDAILASLRSSLTSNQEYYNLFYA